MGWLDDLANVGGAAFGITKGLTAGAEPFNAWETVRGKSLGNDKTDIQLRDLLATQNARENPDLDFYGNAVGAVDAGNRLKTSKDNSDIFGTDRNLALQQYLSDPNGVFQIKARALGLEPGSPEYRQWLAETISTIDPQLGVKAYDAYGIPAGQQRNFNEQAVKAYIEAYAQKYDKGATFHWQPDGSGLLVSSSGEVVPIAPDLLVRAASMMAAKDPYSAVHAGVTDEVAIAKANADLYKAINPNSTMTPAQRTQLLTSSRVGQVALLRDASAKLIAFRKASQSDITMSPEEKDAKESEFIKQADDARKRIQLIDQQMQQGIGGGMPTPLSPLGAPQAQGTSTVTARRLPPGGAAALAAGGGTPAAAGGRAPYRAPGANNTGIRPITTPEVPPADNFGDQDFLMQLLNQTFGGQ